MPLRCKEIQSPAHPWVLSTVCSQMLWLNPTPLGGFHQDFGQFSLHVCHLNCFNQEAWILQLESGWSCCACFLNVCFIAAPNVIFLPRSKLLRSKDFTQINTKEERPLQFFFQRNTVISLSTLKTEDNVPSSTICTDKELLSWKLTDRLNVTRLASDFYVGVSRGQSNKNKCWSFKAFHCCSGFTFRDVFLQETSGHPPWKQVFRRFKDSSSQSGLAIGSSGIFPGGLTTGPFSSRQRFGSGRIGLAENTTPCSCSREKTHPHFFFFFELVLSQQCSEIYTGLCTSCLVNFGCPAARTRFAQNRMKYGSLQTGYSH